MAGKECFEGFSWKGDPSGSEITLGGLPVYHAAPPTPSEAAKTSAILFINDVFGWKASNNRLASDSLARLTGLDVYLPELFGGDIFTMENRLEFLGKHTVTRTEPLIHAVLADVRARHGGVGARVSTSGYCWGAKYALRLGAQGRVSAVVASHPSLVKPEEDDLKNMKAPVLFLIPQTDPIFDAVKEETLAAIKASGAELEVKSFEGVKHGFTVRCDEGDEVAAKARDEATSLTASWFKKHLISN